MYGSILLRQRRLDDARKPIRPIMAVAGEQPHPFAVTLHDQAIAIVFDSRGSIPDGQDPLAALVGMQGSKGDLGMG